MSKKILVIRLDRIGDVVLSTPVIENLRRAYPDSRIAFMVRPYAFDVVNGNPYLNEVIVYDKDGAEKGIWGSLKFCMRLKKKNFDLAIILHPTARSHIAAFLAGIPERAGYDRKLGLLLTRRIPNTKHLGEKHEIDYNLDILKHLGIEVSSRRLCIPVRRDSEKKIRRMLDDYGIKPGDRIAVISPSASCPSKKWPSSNFGRVARELSERLGMKIVVISDAKDKRYADEAVHAAGIACINLAGRTTVSDLVSLLKLAKIFISNDSGPVHIACAVNTPVVVIFGRKDRGLSPQRWGPSGANDIVLHKDVGCKVCLAHNCELGFKCLDAVTPGEVLKAAERILR